MFVKTVKLKKPVAAATAAVICAAIVLLVAVCVIKATGGKSYRVKTEQQRQTLIAELGWETSDKPQEHKTVTLPDEFDDVYSGYNELQKEQGFDLEDYCGKEVEIYTYPVYNYDGHEDCMTLTLIGYDGILVGGDLCCTELDGFMQGMLRNNDNQ